ncbi:single-stranded DNA-binding protein [Curtobacterium ammoniigenes]|uniref:single-stranded DNA-binding protein n=1 Tax=Curtobacterium ammoniigenes TaxID=395387 RepID=UPI000830E2F6|nr:single-stranded DNA-binding protein [Curtobacterium ammoniigenes]
MNDIITVRGIVATEPRHLVTQAGLEITSLRVASQSRKWDRSNSSWTNGETNWFTVTAFRSLAANLTASVNKGDRVVVFGRLRIRNWERDERSGIAVEIEAESIGHDLAWGTGTWERTPRAVADEHAPSTDDGQIEVPEDSAASDGVVNRADSDEAVAIGGARSGADPFGQPASVPTPF